MKRMTGGAAILVVTMLTAPVQLLAQRGPGPMRGMGDSIRGPGVEMILRQREQLELSESQLQQLDRIRQEAVERRTAHQAQMQELRSKVRAGDMKVEELRTIAEARRTAAVEVRRQQQERIESVLNDAQKQKVEQWRATARGFRMGRMSAMRGQREGMRGMRQGMRGGRDEMRGGRDGMRGSRRGGPGYDGGPGFAPGMRQQRFFGPGAGSGGAWERGWRRGGPGQGFGFGPPDTTRAPVPLRPGS